MRLGLSLISGLALVIAAIAAVQARDIEMGGDSNYPYSIMAAQQQGLYGVPATATGIYMHTCAM